MKIAFGVLPALVLASALTFFSPAAVACNDRGNCDNAPGHNKEIQGAPAPLIGVGLSGLAIGLGYGAYWLVRRRRNAS